MKRAVLAFVFLLGAIAGVAFERALFHFMPPFPPDPAEIELFLTKELSLDNVQRTKIHVILLDTDAQMRALHDKTRGDFEAEIVSTQHKIDALLRPDQKAKSDALKARMEERRKKFQGQFVPPVPFP